MLRGWGHSTLAHPWAFNTSAEIAVMVSGNAMAHLYLDIANPERSFGKKPGGALPLAHALLVRESVDLLILPTSPESCEIHTRDRGMATLDWRDWCYDYAPQSGDPLGIGAQRRLTDDAAYDVTIESDYPDALVQIAHLVSSPRSGDIILSAARNWDFRAKYEPIPHVSSHGALHREHMLVPLLLNSAPERAPRRTVDVMPSALSALGVDIPRTVEGRSFL